MEKARIMRKTCDGLESYLWLDGGLVPLSDLSAFLNQKVPRISGLALQLDGPVSTGSPKDFTVGNVKV